MRPAHLRGLPFFLHSAGLCVEKIVKEEEKNQTGATVVRFMKDSLIRIKVPLEPH